MSRKRTTTKKPDIKPDIVPFPLFKEFPKDIRVLIWETALPRLRERVVRVREAELKKNRGEWYDERREKGLPVPDVWTPETIARRKETRLKALQGCSRPPQILFVCREAYETASLFYARLFEDDVVSSPGIYFSPKTDILYPRYRLFSMGSHDRGGFARRVMVDDLHYLPQAKQVCNLALLLDKEVIEEIGSWPESDDSDESDNEPQVNDSKYFIEPNDLESLIASVLLNFQGGVKHLTIVVKDFSIPQEFYPDSNSQLLFIDPLEIDNASQRYHREFETRYKLKGYIQPKQPELPVIEYDWAMVDGKKLERLRKESAEKWQDRLWTVPEIEYKVAITEGERDFVRWLYWASKPKTLEMGSEDGRIYQERMANLRV